MILFLSLLSLLRVHSLALAIEPPRDKDTYDRSYLEGFDGKIIHSLRIEGLTRTRERAVRWLAGGKEGETFESTRWISGLRKLYNTSILYDLETKVTTLPSSEVDIVLKTRDRWSLYPYFQLQGGGGSVNVMFGLNEANLLGYFTNVWAQMGIWDSQISYEFSAFQEWFMDTDYSIGFDFARNTFPLQFISSSGEQVGSFALVRYQNIFSLWKRFGDKARLNTNFVLFRDNVQNASGITQSEIFNGTQYSVTSSLIFGRSNFTTFLEVGEEKTITPVLTNLFRDEARVAGVTTSFKKVWIDSKNNNPAIYVAGGVMSNAPYVYRYNLGGYDSVRGFSIYRARGTVFARTSLEYRKYVTQFQLPFDLDRVNVQVVPFLDAGAVAARGDATQTLISAGIGARFNFVHFVNAIMRIDLARTVLPDEGFGIAFGVGQFF